MKLKELYEDIIKKTQESNYTFVYEDKPKDKYFANYKVYMTDSKETELVSCWLTIISTDEIYIEYIGVEEGVGKGQGLGSKLMEKVIEFCKSKGFEELTLRMDNGVGCPSRDQSKLLNNALYRFYSRFGFVFTWTQEECDNSDDNSPCAMTLNLNKG